MKTTTYQQIRNDSASAHESLIVSVRDRSTGRTWESTVGYLIARAEAQACWHDLVDGTLATIGMLNDFLADFEIRWL